MKILFATTAGAGHLGPLVPFAQACRRAGHDVLVAAPGSFEPEVRRAGLEFAAFGDRSEADAGALFAMIGAASFEEANRLMVREGYAGIFPRAALPALLALVDGWRPSIIVHETAELASLVVAVGRGIPRAQVAIGMLGLLGPFVDGLTQPLVDLGAQHGLTIPADPGLLIAEPVLTLTPGSLDDGEGARVHRFRVLADDMPADPTLEGEGPLIYVTFGSEAAGQGLYPDLYAATIGALASPDWRLLVTIGREADPSALGSLPGVRVERWIAQNAVLPQAGVVVCHGGYGTVLGALTAGVPVVVMPLFAMDQRENGRRTAEIGAGLAIGGPGDLSVLRAAVSSVLAESRFRSAAQAIAEEIRRLPPVDDAVEVITALAR